MKHKYFSIAEMTASETAKQRKIDNTPNAIQLANLDELMTVLDQIRAAYGKPIRVTSGFRCEVLNKAVGGVKTSAHLYGYAADLQVTGDLDAFYKFVLHYLREKKILFDQLIFETSGKTR